MKDCTNELKEPLGLGTHWGTVAMSGRDLREALWTFVVMEEVMVEDGGLQGKWDAGSGRG